MKRLTALFTGILLLVPALAAEDTADRREALALELIAITDMDSLSTSMTQHLRETMAMQLESMIECEAMRPAISTYVGEMAEIIEGYMNSTELLGDTAIIYMQHFDVDELQAMVDFYHTPVGRKMLDKMPELMQEVMHMTQNHMQDLQPRMQGMLGRFSESAAEVAAQCDSETLSGKP